MGFHTWTAVGAIVLQVPTDDQKFPVLCSGYIYIIITLLPTGSVEREVLGVGSIPVAILPSCQDMKTIAL